jgi:hypothetical protein
MLHFGIYIDDDAHEMTVIQIHPDDVATGGFSRLASVGA